MGIVPDKRVAPIRATLFLYFILLGILGEITDRY